MKPKQGSRWLIILERTVCNNSSATPYLRWTWLPVRLRSVGMYFKLVLARAEPGLNWETWERAWKLTAKSH